ncbi:two-component regulator propeller domain-containing protein [Tenacibaculum sp. IB213877]|uniref:type IX secretion system anionic LPS delivery protein PorZ n=1 Tax=Tenacibaculum sp. IB213877 TaxID=3097351 RepID=UPI002A5ABF2D|nr:two-component regulator propeller domain-containing protein [Tenacibaculum sp. IB213877]MDY0781311.1 two-component regulator propeller domain-containing protein [Tenacibaculum sp. IB213877]
MKKISTLFFLFITLFAFSQIDYSNQWEDFFSYNNVKDFVLVDDVIFALSDNAVFTYNLQTQETQKLSSVNGLSGEDTSAIHYNEQQNRLIIGYETGLIEVVDENGRITISPDIENFNQSGLKSINSIYEYNNKLYLATSFAIVVYDIQNLEFGDTYFIGSGSTSVNVNQVTVFNDKIYAVTENGIYVANINNSNLIDANNWELRFVGNYQKIIQFSGDIYAVSNQNLIRLNGNSQQQVLNFSENIVDIKASDTNLVVSLPTRVVVYNSSLTQVGENIPATDFNFTLNSANLVNNTVFLATAEYGILSASVSTQNYSEIHPKGPLSNEVFSIDVYNNNLWIVYGGYDATYTPVQKRQGFTHFNGENWSNTPFNTTFPFGDLVHVTIDKQHDNRVFISSFGDTNNPNELNTPLTGGLYEIENDQISVFYNHLNSPLEDIVPNDASRVTIRVSGSTFDREGNLWVTNLIANHRLKKLSLSGQWSSYNINELILVNRPGLNEIVMDNSNSLWIGSRGNGVLIYNENGNRKRSFTTEPTKGSLPNLNVRTVAVDKNNRVWLGTLSGLVVYNNAAGVFDANIYDAEPIIILDDGIAKKLLGDQTINSIKVDGANNKWFGTDNGGVLYTNPNGQNTLANFNKDNSPLPSNKILKIAVDEKSGKVYFATNKGIVAYNSKVSPFGDVLGEVYAYPNPALKNHDSVTIDGRNGTNLPKGTNVKILDVAGNLVYETNVIEGQQVQGGKVVWNKRNLAGNKVASGVYIVLLATEDGQQTSTTKIAIIN